MSNWTTKNQTELMRTFYNEWEAFPAAWLENLAAAGKIAPGTVSTKSICDLEPADLAGYERVHLFAGIGGWELALQLAGWPADLPVWTGSCPCQPFSSAGKRKGTTDERHLWPEMLRLIRECRPPVIFGEQVASKLGRVWLASLHTDLETLGYAVGAADLCAAGVGAPHIRQRLWWGAVRLADAGQGISKSRDVRDARGGHSEAVRVLSASNHQRCGELGGLGHAASLRQCGGPPDGSGLAAEVLGAGHEVDRNPCADGLADLDGSRRGEVRTGEAGDRGEAARQQPTGLCLADPWANPEWLLCADGKARPTRPGLFPLAHGIPNRVGKLRAAGNAIVPQVAAQFVTAFMKGTTYMTPQPTRPNTLCAHCCSRLEV